MNLQPISNMYAPVFWGKCSTCGSSQMSDAMVADLDAKPGTYLCLFCADGHDPLARERVRREGDYQWTRLSAHQRARAISAKGLPR